MLFYQGGSHGYNEDQTEMNYAENFISLKVET
jgi:hypothetical protein